MGSAVRLGFVLLFCCIASIVAIKLDGDSKSTSELLNTQIEFMRINSESVAAESLKNLKDRLTKLELEFKKLDELSNPRRVQNGSCEIAMQLLLSHYSSIDSQLKNLQKALEDRTKKEDGQDYVKQIVDAIKSGNFKLADEKILELPDMVQLEKIVHEVYANSEANFDTIVKLSKSLSKITPTYHVLKALHDEMRKNSHRDPIKLITLAKSFENEILKQYNDPNDIKASTTIIIKLLEEAIKTSATTFFAIQLGSGDYRDNEDVHILAKAIVDYSQELSDEVMKHLVDTNFGLLETSVILDTVKCHRNLSQVVSGISALFWKIKTTGNLNSSIVLDLASDLSKLQAKDEFATLSPKTKDSVNKVVQNLPTCARNLFFKPSVCLWNKARNTYLFAADSSFNYNKERRNIFTSSAAGNKHAPDGSSWFVEKIDDKIFFKSTEFKNEYLYAAAIDYNPEVRYVFNWIVGGNTDDQSAFNVELDGDYCYIKNVYFKEYVFASEYKYKPSHSFSHVLTWKPGTLGDGYEFVWQIRNC